MSSTVDDVSNISGGGLKQELLETAVQEDVLHTSTILSTLSTSIDDISSKVEEEQLLKSSPARMPEGTADSTTDCLVVAEKKAELLDDNNDLPSPQKMLTEPDSTGSPPQVQIKTSPLIEMPSLGPDLTITEINDDIKENDNKHSAEVLIFKVENQTINDSLVQGTMKSAMAHINGMVLNGKKSINGSTDYTSSCMPVITVNNDGETNDELPVSGDHMQVKNNPEIPAIKWGIMNKKASSPHRQKKLPLLAPKPAVTAAILSPQQSSSPVGPATPQSPPPPDLFLQLLRLPQPVVEKCTSPTSTSVPQQEDGKSIQLPQQQQQQQQQQQRPTALVNPFPAQKHVRDNSGTVTIYKGTQADDGGDTVTIPAIVVNGPVAVKNQQDTQDLDMKNVCVVPKVINRQHQRWTQTTLLDFHRIKNITTTSASNIQPVSATATVPVQQQQQQQQQVAIQQQQPHMRNKSVGSSTVGAAAMLTPVMTKLQAGGTVCVTGAGVGPNAVVGCLKQNKTEQDDASILHQLLATQQAAASVAEQTGNSIAGVLGEVDLQQHNVATTPAEMSVIDMLKRLGTVVELEEQKDPPPPHGDLVALTAAAPAAEQSLEIPNALALLENIKIDKPQSPVVKALEDTPASSPTSQIKHCSIPPMSTTTFYLGKDISVFPHVTPPVTSHIPIAPVPVQPKRTTQIPAKSTSTQLSSVPTQPRLPPDVSVFATTRNANNPADSKTVKQLSLNSLAKQVKGCLSPKHQQQQHPILEEVNQLNAQRSRQHQQQRNNQLPKQQQQSQAYQVISGQQQKTSPKRKSSLTKDPAQYNHVALHHLEPEIDIVEGDNVLSSEGTFIFNMDSFFNVDLPNNDMIYSCDICSAVYQHPHRLKKHYLRLHIARQYIAKRDLDAFNIDSKSECNEEHNDVEKVAKGEENNSHDGEIKLVFRCHTCRKCVATKAELKSHLTDHPPVVDLKKQVVKGVKNYKCDYCNVFFKWKKMFLKHKKNCRLQPSIQGTTIPAPATPITTPVMAAPAKLQGDVDKPKKTIKTSTTTAVVSSTTSKYTSVNTATTATATTTSVSTAITTVTSSINTNITAVTTSSNTFTVATTTVLDANSATATTTSAVNTAPVLSNSNIPTTTVPTSTTTASPGYTYKAAKAGLSRTSTSKATSLVATTTIKTVSTNTCASTKAASTNISATAKAGPSSSTSTKTTSTTTSAKTKAASTVTTKATSAKSSTATKAASANISTARKGTSKANTSSARSTAAKISTTALTVKTAFTGIVKTRRVRNSLKNVIRLLHHCLYCNETFHNGNSKRNHTLSNHPYVRKVHPCVFCQRDFVSNNSLFTHLLENHATVYFACAACKDRFTNLQELGSHNDRTHSLDEVEKLAFNKRISTIRQDKDCYTCQICQRMFVIETSYKLHKCTPPEQQATPEVIKRERNSSTTLNTSTTSNCSPNVSLSTITTVSGINNTNGNNTERNDNKPVKVRAKKSKYNGREVKTDTRVQLIDPEVAFFSQVSRNVRENLQNHLDGRLVQSGDDSGDDMGNCSIKTEGTKKILLKTPESGRRTRSPKIMNRLSLGSPTIAGGGGTQQKGGIVGNNALSRLSIGQDDKGVASSNQNDYSKPRASPWEKYAFPKEYDGRCGLTSYIKDISYLDISTQLIMRRNMQSSQGQDGELMDGEEWYLNGEKVDIPSVLALERMAAKCAESFSNDDSTLNGGDDPLNNDGISTANGELSGEWVRERTYVCLVCGWETHCLWSMEDHKYDVHPSVVCPRLELVGDQRKLAKKIYTRLSNAPAPFNKIQSEKQYKAPQEITCTKCNSKGYATAHELHVHLLECAGEKVPQWIRNAVSGSGRSQTPRKRKWSRKRRRPRRGLKRNIPNTPQKPNRARSKPGDTDTIQKMIANLPAKRLTRRVIAFDEKDLKTRSQSHIQNPPLQQQTAKSAASKTNGAKSKNNGHLLQQHDSTTTGGAIGEMNTANKLDSSTPKATSPSSSPLPVPLKRTNNIDTSAEGGDVLSSLRMMPVSSPRPELLGTQQILDRVLGLSARVKEEEAALSSGIKCTGCGQAYESKTVLRRHHKSCAYFRECGPISQHRCQTCHKTFDNLVALIEHTCEEIPPRLEAEESMTSSTETVSSTVAQVDNKDIPVLSPVLEGDNKVESGAKGEKTNKSSSTPFGEVKENMIIPLVIKEENFEKSKKTPLSQTTAVQTVDHYPTYTNEVPMLPISSTTPAPAAAGGGAVSSFLNVPYHSVKTASLICGISFVDGFIKYETVNSVSKETETILELSGTKKGDNLNKRGRPKRKSGEEASVALFHTMNSGRRSNSGARAEKNETTKIRKTKKGVARKSEMPDDKIMAQTAGTTVSSNALAKTIQRRGRCKPKVSSTIIHSAIQEPVVSSDLPEDEIKVNVETDDKEDKVKSGNDDKEVTVSPIEGSKIQRKRKWSNSPEKKANMNSSTEDINNSQLTSPNKSSDNLPSAEVVKRKRGRPFGSLNRKSNGLPERRSSRCRARNVSGLETTPTSTRTMKFEKPDDILLFNEEEDLVKGSAQKSVMSRDNSPSKRSSEMESLEKKRRNRWSGKQQPCRDNSPDTTTIVVQAEVHPEPSPRRIRTEITLSGTADEQLNSEEKPVEACRKTSLGRKKRIEQDSMHNLKSIKKERTEVGMTTSVDEISVLAVEEIVMEIATADEDNEITSRMEKLQSPSVDKKETNCPESSVDSVVKNINDIKYDLKGEYIEEIEIKKEPGEIVDTTMNEHENWETQESEHIVEESGKTSYVKKMKKKNKKKKKGNTIGLKRSISPQQSVSSIKKIKKTCKDEKLKKNIKAAALSIARLKKRKKFLQIKNDRRQDNKKEVVKVAGFSWEVSELAKSPEKSPVTASTQLANNTNKPINSTLCPSDTKDGILQPQTVCSCSNRASPLQQAPCTATSTTSVLMAQAADINPPTPATFHYTLTKEDWLSQTTAPLASSTVHPVHPVPIVHHLATSGVSQTLCTLQPAILNHQHQQQAQNCASLIQQVGACQATIALNQQPQDISTSCAPVLHTPHITYVPTTLQQTIGPNCAATVGPAHAVSETQPVQLVNSLQFTENSLINVPQQSVGQPLLPPQHVSYPSVSHTVAQTAVKATSIYTSPLQYVPVSSQLEFHLPTKTILATAVDQVVIPPPPSFQSSPPCHQVSVVQNQQQMQIDTTTSKQIPGSFHSSVNPTLSISTVSSSSHQEIDIGPVAAVPLQPANSSLAVVTNTICTVPTSQLQCYPTNQSLIKEEGTVQAVLLDTLQSQQQSVIQNPQNFTSLPVVTTQITEQPTSLISSVPSVSLPLTSETAQITSSNIIQSSQSETPVIKTTATIQDCITSSSSNQLMMMDQQLPAVSGSTLAPSLGTIIDSVNKLLNEPELSTGGYSSLSHYSCMTDIHNYCTEDDLTVLQHLGEAAAVEMQDDMLDLKPNINELQMTTECETTDYWSPGDSKSLMDLDNQPPQEQPPPVNVHQQDIVSNTASTSSNSYVFTQENTNRSLLNLQHLKDEINNSQGVRKRRASPALKLMDAYEGKEVVCPTCHSQFLGFSALQAHVEKAHNQHSSAQTTGNNNSTVAQTGQVTSINRRVVLESCKGNRRVCHVCQQILPANLMMSHLSDEHALDHSSFLGDPNQDPACGERLKTKLATALGDLLDKAVHNLVLSKSRTESQLSAGAAELLSRLCAIRLKDSSFKQRLNSKEKPSDTEELIGAKLKELAKSYPCEFCGLKFTTLCSKKKHQKLAHPTMKTPDHIDTYSDIDEYENDWRGVPSPNSSTNDGTGDTSDTFHPTCSECGLSFPTLSEMMRHRTEDHGRQGRRLSSDIGMSSSSRPHTPSSVQNSNVSCGSGSGSATPNNMNTVSASNSSCLNSSTAVSLANTLSRLQQRTRSSSVETQSSCGGSSVTTTTNSSRGGRAGSNGRGGGNCGRSVTSSQPKIQVNPSADDDGGDSSGKEVVKGKSRRSTNKKSNSTNFKKQQTTTTTTGGGQQKCNNNGGSSSSRSQRGGGGRAARRGSLQNNKTSTSMEEAAKAEQALLQLTRERSGSNMLRNRTTNTTSSSDAAATTVAVTNNSNNCHLPSAYNPIF